MFVCPDGPASTETLLIHARAQCGLEEYCRVRKVPFEAVMRECGLDRARREMSFSGYISLRAHARMLEACARHCGDELFALRWTRMMGAGAENTVSLAVRHAPDLRSGFEVAARFLRIAVDLDGASAVVEGRTASLQFAFSPELVCRNQLVDRTVSKTLALLMRSAGPDARLVEVELSRDLPANTAAHEAFFGVPVRYRAEGCRITIHTGDADVSNPFYDADLFAALCELNQRRLADRRRADDFIAVVSDAIAARIQEPGLTIGDVANAVATSVRVLQRRLAGRGLTFNQLHDSVRRRMAEDLLAHTDFPVSEIAFRLGFSAVGNFTRAARRWFGCPPSEWRRADGRDGR